MCKFPIPKFLLQFYNILNFIKMILNYCYIILVSNFKIEEKWKTLHFSFILVNLQHSVNQVFGNLYWKDTWKGM